MPEEAKATASRRSEFERDRARVLHSAALRRLDVATVVIHGTDDPLIDVSGGEATAAAIPGARLELIRGMGHDLPRQLWPRFVELIAENAARAVPQPQA